MDNSDVVKRPTGLRYASAAQPQSPKKRLHLYALIFVVFGIINYSALFLGTEEGIVLYMEHKPNTTPYLVAGKRDVLFVISTNAKQLPTVLKNFMQYPQDRFGLLVNMYDGSKPNLPDNLGNNVHTSFIEGTVKQVFWKTVTTRYTKDYQYVWFMDDDMEFGLDVFAFWQFYKVVRDMNVFLSTPSTIDYDKRTSHHHRNYLRHPRAEEFARITDHVEQDSMFFLAKAWDVFNEKIVTPAENMFERKKHQRQNDWGLDCMACEAMYQEILANEYDAIPCARIVHTGIIHMDKQSLTDGSKKDFSFFGDDEIVKLNIHRYDAAMKTAYKNKHILNIDCPGDEVNFFLIAYHNFEVVKSSSFRAMILRDMSKPKDQRMRQREWYTAFIKTSLGRPST